MRIPCMSQRHQLVHRFSPYALFAYSPCPHPPPACAAKDKDKMEEELAECNKVVKHNEEAAQEVRETGTRLGMGSGGLMVVVVVVDEALALYAYRKRRK